MVVEEVRVSRVPENLGLTAIVEGLWDEDEEFRRGESGRC